MLLRRMPPVIQSVRSESLTYLEDLALYDLASAVREAGRARREGIFIEAGCALGGSAIVIATTKEPHRPFHVYDVFGMPPPTESDGPEVHERYRVVAGGGSERLARKSRLHVVAR
jgi:asparagine synthase (glutamine-hydrolysing)